MTSTITATLQRHAKEIPDQLACKFYSTQIDCKSITFANLYAQACQVGQVLQVHVQEKDRILLLMPPSIEYIIAFFGCLYAGAIPVPAYPPRNSYHMQRLNTIIEDANAEVILTISSLLPKINSPLTTLAIDALPCIESRDHPSPHFHSSDIAFFQYTSGSTGTPKAVMISHGNLIDNIGRMKETFEVITPIKPCSWLPPYHDMGLIGCILVPIYLGQTAVLMSPISFIKKPLLWLEIISKEQLTISPAPNFAYDLCVKAAKKGIPSSLDLSCFKIAINGAEPLHVDTLRNFINTFSPHGFKPEAMYPSYGMAESTLILSFKKPFTQFKTLCVDRKLLEDNLLKTIADDNSKNSMTLVGSGVAISGHEAIIVHPETQEKLSTFQIGEICIAGPSVTTGYWQNSDLNDQAFIKNFRNKNGYPYFRTGDLGFIDLEGELFITGRLKDIIIINGRNFYAHDIERVTALSHSCLITNSGAAFSLMTKGAEKLVIVQEIKREPDKFSDIYRAILQKIWDEFDIRPNQILLIQQASINKTTSGKIQRNACREALLKNNLKIIDEWCDTKLRIWDKEAP